MSDQTAPEPTMEEILASIRRIISEDDAPEGQSVEAPAEDDDEDVLELTQTVDESQSASHEDYAAPSDYAPEPAFEEPEPPAAPEPVAAAPRREEPLISPQAATAAASAFGQLNAVASQPRDSRTIEDVTRELLAPMLRAWLDENLPRIVQAAVREEVERISRSRVG
jgi:cell pole-organizing protein PopZ